jgi:hypothetical protein
LKDFSYKQKNIFLDMRQELLSPWSVVFFFFLETNRSVASQEIPRFLWNPVAVYCANKSHTLLPP